MRQATLPQLANDDSSFFLFQSICLQRHSLSGWLWLLLLAGTVNAQTYSLGWHGFSAGAGTSTGGVYTVIGSIAPLIAGEPMKGGSYSVAVEFPALYSVQTASSPALHVLLSGTNTVVVWWPSAAQGWRLQENSALDSTRWLAPIETVTDTGTNKFIVITPAASETFYRLIQP